MRSELEQALLNTGWIELPKMAVRRPNGKYGSRWLPKEDTRQYGRDDFAKAVRKPCTAREEMLALQQEDIARDNRGFCGEAQYKYGRWGVAYSTDWLQDHPADEKRGW